MAYRLYNPIKKCMDPYYPMLGAVEPLLKSEYKYFQDMLCLKPITGNRTICLMYTGDIMLKE